MNQPRFIIKIITDITPQFAQEWQTLWERSENQNFFNSYQWFQSAKETYGWKDCKIFACYKNLSLVAVLPTRKYRRFGVPVTGSVANDFLYNTAFLLEKVDQELIREFIGYIVKNSNVYITRIEDRIAKILRQLFPEMEFFVMAAVPYLKLESDPLRYMHQHHLKRVRDMFRKNASDLEFKTYDSNSDLQLYVKKMFEIEQNSSKKLHSRDLFSNQINRNFYLNMTKYCRDLIQISFINYRGVPFTYSFSLKYARTFLGLQMAYLPMYKRFSPGKMLIVCLLENLKGNGIETFDFGAGLSDFKRGFTPDYFLEYDLYYSRAYVVRLWWKIINYIRRFKKILMHEKHTLDHLFLFKLLK